MYTVYLFDQKTKLDWLTRLAFEMILDRRIHVHAVLQKKGNNFCFSELAGKFKACESLFAVLFHRSAIERTTAGFMIVLPGCFSEIRENTLAVSTTNGVEKPAFLLLRVDRERHDRWIFHNKQVVHVSGCSSLLDSIVDDKRSIKLPPLFLSEMRGFW